MPIADILRHPQVIDRLLNIPTSMLMVITPEGRILYANTAMLETFGVPEDQVIGVTVSDLPFLTDVGKGRILELLKNTLAGATTSPTAIDYRDYAQHPRQGTLQGEFVHSEDGQVLAGIVVIESQPVSAQPNNELDVIRQTLSQHLAVIDAIILILDVDGRVEYVNESGARILGYTGNELTGTAWIERCIKPEDRERVMQIFHEIIDGNLTYGHDHQNNDVVCKDGSFKTLAWRNAVRTDPEGRIIGTISYATDISELVRSRGEIRRAKDFLERILNAVADPIFVKDHDHRMVIVNDAEVVLTGFPREQVIGKTDRDFFPETQVNIFWENDNRVLETGQENINAEQITAASGETRDIVTKKSRVLDAEGQPYIVGVIRDVTELTRTQTFLQIERNFVQALAGSSGFPDCAREIVEIGSKIPEITAAVLLIKGQDETLSIAESIGYDPEFLAGVAGVLQQTPVGDEKPDTLTVFQTYATIRETYQLPESEILAVAICQILEETRVIGSLILSSSTKSEFSPDTRETINRLGTHLNAVASRFRVERENTLRTKVLTNIATTNDLLLQAEDWRTVAEIVLKTFGQAFGVHRAYIFQVTHHSDSPVIRQLFEWTASGTAAMRNDPMLASFDMERGGLGRWHREFRQKRPVASPVRLLPEAERPEFLRQGIKSIVAVPIFSGDTWWGILGFDDCAVERVWSVIETEGVMTLASTFGSAILRSDISEKVRRNEQRFRTILEQTGQMTYEVDQASGRTQWFGAIEQMTGYSVAEFTEIHHAQLIDHIHPDDRTATSEALATITTANASLYHAFYRLRRKDGSYLSVEDKGVVTTSEHGNRILLGTINDMTLQDQRAQSLTMLSNALEAAANGVVITDPSGSIVWVNRAVVDLTGYRQDELIGRNPRILKSGKQSPEIYSALWKTITSGETWRGRIINRRKDGSEYPEAMVITPVRKEQSGAIMYFIAIKQNIAKELVTEQMLDKRAKELERLNALMVGRELKMIELKKEIARLKQEHP